MIDYGLFALIVVILTLVFLAFHAWRGIKADGDRIRAEVSKCAAIVGEMERALGGMEGRVSEAKAIAVEVQGTHYKTLLRRIDEAEATSLGHVKQVEVLAEKIASLGGRLSSLQRWRKELKEPEGEDLGGEQVEAFPVAPVPPPVAMNNGHFGRIVGRKGG